MENKLREIYDDLESTLGNFEDLKNAVDYLSICGNSGMTENQYVGLVRTFSSNLVKLYDDFGDKLEVLYELSKTHETNVA